MYKNKFSQYLKLKKPLIKKLVEELSATYPYVSCLGTDVLGTRISVNKNVTSVNPSSITEAGFVVRVKGNNIYSEYSFNEISERNYSNIKQTIIDLANQSLNVEHIDVALIKEENLKKDFIRKNTGIDYSVDEIISIFKQKIETKLTKSELINLYLSCECAEYSKMFISSNKELTQYYTYSSVTAYAVSKKDEIIKDGYCGEGFFSLEEAINSCDSLIDYSINTSIALLDATVPVPGVYTIITNPSITGLIAHEAFGHGVEMDMFVKNRAKSKEYINKFVASKLVTMHDGAASCNSAASYFFDDDGVLAQDTVIIEKGVLKRGISDALSASILNEVPTGNGRRESFKRKAYTRMTNTFFEKGTSSLEEMIKSVDYGYMIFDTNNGMEDPKNWGIQCTALYGKEIKNGEFTGKIVSPVVMSGDVIDLLTNISMISTGFEIHGVGSCGKGYKEWVRVSDGGACLKTKVKIG